MAVPLMSNKNNPDLRGRLMMILDVYYYYTCCVGPQAAVAMVTKQRQRPVSKPLHHTRL